VVEHLDQNNFDLPLPHYQNVAGFVLEPFFFFLDVSLCVTMLLWRGIIYIRVYLCVTPCVMLRQLIHQAQYSLYLYNKVTVINNSNNINYNSRLNLLIHLVLYPLFVLLSLLCMCENENLLSEFLIHVIPVFWFYQASGSNHKGFYHTLYRNMQNKEKMFIMAKI